MLTQWIALRSLKGVPLKAAGLLIVVKRIKLCLAAKLETFNQVLIAFRVLGIEIVQEFTPPGYKLKESPACGEILFMSTQVLGEVIDARGQLSHLNISTSSILVMDLVILCFVLFFRCFCIRHSSFRHSSFP